MIRWAPEAADDLASAVQFVRARNPRAARRLGEGILQLVEQLGRGDLDGPLVTLRTGEQVQSWPLPPYRVYYRREQETLTVLRVFHQARLPIVREK